MSQRQRCDTNKAMQIAISRTNNLSDNTEMPNGTFPATASGVQRSQLTFLRKMEEKKKHGPGHLARMRGKQEGLKLSQLV